MQNLGLDFAAAVGAQPAPWKRCTCCNRAYTRRQWLGLPLKGLQRCEGHPEGTLSLRDCACGSTLAVLLAAEGVR